MRFSGIITKPSDCARIASLLYQPLKNGMPAIASTPISIVMAVIFIFGYRPPILVISCS